MSKKKVENYACQEEKTSDICGPESAKGAGGGELEEGGTDILIFFSVPMLRG
ncbi:MAG: hypothetical protein HWE15_06600 [Algoriphagus sp.]|uniref:hypothetical protein n=1 Tax=Algoriphagus sp. TaxID=1872435 RepID=UPI0017D7FD94|nr:hypothetical protein [Algoriphagus sp.]NVJ85955.1 hypothetical protein [Algoriphagus sp.]